MTVDSSIHNHACLVLIFTACYLISLTHAHPNQQQQTIAEDPSDQQAKIGDRAVLKCRIRNLRGEPQWCIDDFCLGVSKTEPIQASSSSSGGSHHLTLKGRPRYRIVGDRAKGEFDLLIEPVQLQDNMYFYCMTTAASETIKAVKSKRVFLTVLTHPQSLHLASPVHVSLNKPSSIQCVAKQSRPPVKILVSINGQLITDESRYKTQVVQYPASAAHLSNQNGPERRWPNSQDHVEEAAKRKLSIPLTSPISAEVLRESYYDTITNVSVDDITMRMQGQNVECYAYSFVNWNSNGNQNNNNLRYLIHYASRNGANSVHSNVMHTKAMIQVDYAPEVNLKIVSTNRVLREDDVISLLCETKATPAIQSYRWYIGKNYLSGVMDSSLNLKLRKEMHKKTLTCEASNTVASVKASIQLNILFKPAFVKGSKTYMQIDKNACNKPLTLDCQVSSNPYSNVTWYRRRLSSQFLNRILELDKHGRDSVIRSLSGEISSKTSKLIKINLNDFSADGDNNYQSVFYDEPIGTGPTYTIASFNCANVLANLKNRTNGPARYAKATRAHLAVSPTTTVKPASSTPSARATSTRRAPRQKEDKSAVNYSAEEVAEEDNKTNNNNTDEETSEPTSEDYYADKSSSANVFLTSETEEAEYYVYEDEEVDAEEGAGESGDLNDFLRSSADKQRLDLSSDFGVYMCEAQNNIHSAQQQLNSESLSYFSRNNQVPAAAAEAAQRRYIKLNPIGVPVSHALPSSMISGSFIASSAVADEAVNYLMKSSVTDAYAALTYAGVHSQAPLIEIPSTIGASASLTCLVEPLPHLDTLIWLKDNGRIIPNSRFSIAESSSSAMDSAAAFSADSMRLRNVKVKHENLTLTAGNSKLDHVTAATAADDDDDDDDQVKKLDRDELINADLLATNGVRSVDGQAISLMRSVLFIKSVRREDLGVYKCKAVNAFGSRTILFLLRERNFLDRLNMNSYMRMLFLLVASIVAFVILLLLTLCITSKQIRRVFCCCCFCCRGRSYSRNYKNKKLIDCGQSSNKVMINDWLASSKLSSDSANNNNKNKNNNNNNSLINTSSAHHNPSTNTAMTLLNGTSDLITDSSSSTSTKNTNTNHNSSSSSGQPSFTNSPNHHHHHHHDDLLAATVHCSSMLNEDDCELDSSSSSKYQTSQQLAKLLMSSQKETSFDLDHVQTTDLLNEEDVSYAASSKLLKCSSPPPPSSSKVNTTTTTPSLVLRSHNFSNGNFNAKISAKVTSSNSSSPPKTIMPPTSSMNDILNAEHNGEPHSVRFLGNAPPPPPTYARPHQFSNFTISKLNYEANKKEYYDNAPSSANTKPSNFDISKMNNAEFNKMMNDNSFRLSDLFNELNPNLTNNSINSTFLANSKAANLTSSNNNTSSFIANSFSTSSSSSSSPTSSSTQSNLGRAPLLTATTQSNGNSTAAASNNNPNTFNKFPLPFSNANTLTHTTNRIYNKNSHVNGGGGNSNSNIYTKINDYHSNNNRNNFSQNQSSSTATTKHLNI